MELLLAISCKILTKSVSNIFLREEDVYALEACIIWSHAEILQSRDSIHALFWHILLSQYLCKLLSTVVTIVDEDNNIALTDSTVYIRIADSLDKLVGYALVVAFLHSLYHICRLLAFALYQEVVSFLHTIPTLITVHSIETTNDACDMCAIVVAALLYILDKALTALRVGITTVHEAMYEHLVCQTILLTNLDELEEMVK